MNDYLLYFIFFLFLILYLGTFIFIGIYLIIRGFKKIFNNLIYAGIALCLIAVAQVTDIIFNFNLIIDRFFTGLFIIFVVIFTNNTFHKEQRSIIFHQDRMSYLPFIIIFVSILNMGIAIYLSFLKELENSLLIHFIRTLHDFFAFGVAFFWLGGSSYYAYSEIKNQYIEPWIKIRYKVITLVSIIPPFLQILSFFQPWNVRFGHIDHLGSFIIFGITAILSMILSITFLIAWVMPNRLKEILNKNYKQIIDKDFSQEELTEFIKYLGVKLAEKIDLTPTAARGLIKLSIQEHFNNYRPFSNINFKNFKEIIQGTLKKRLINLHVENFEAVIEFLQNSLIKSQSLITFGSF